MSGLNAPVFTGRSSRHPRPPTAGRSNGRLLASYFSLRVFVSAANEPHQQWRENRREQDIHDHGGHGSRAGHDDYRQDSYDEETHDQCKGREPAPADASKIALPVPFARRIAAALAATDADREDGAEDHRYCRSTPTRL